MRPVVTQPLFDYKSIVLIPGDQVGIEAAGCVQTGGAGSTWKRYVNPSGPNSSRLYFGSLEIPGAIANTRFSTLQGQTIKFEGGTPTTLVLHYTDDNYGDNGYYSHDNGTQNQCAGPTGGPAHVTLTITHAVTPPPPPPPVPCIAFPPSSLPWDLAAAFSPDAASDDNCLPLNPRWLWQRPNVANVPAFGRNQATQITGTDNSATCAAKSGGRDGHVNWIDVTYTGKLQWEGHDRHYPFGDDDYNVLLLRPTIPGTIFMAGGTEANPVSIKGEFDSDETIDHFDRSSWWRRFHAAVDLDGFNTSGIGTRAGGLIDGHDAVMTGLMSLDTFHSDNKSEIHPVHALAIRRTAVPNPADDEWAIFVRNFGNQGYCGNGQHYVSRTSISIRIPRPPGLPASALAIPDLRAGRFFKHNAPNLGRQFDWQVRSIPEGDAVVTFFLNTPTQKSFMFGVLSLSWSEPGARRAGERISPAQSTGASAQEADGTRPADATAASRHDHGEDDGSEAEGPEESAEERALYAALSPAQRYEIDAMIRAGLPSLQLDVEEARGTTIIGAAEPSSEGPVIFDGPDERTEKVRDVSYGALCTVTRGVTPQAPSLCEATTKVRGDINGDRDVDRHDLKILWMNLNRPVDQSACGVRCDLDGDGIITKYDARNLVKLCTRPQCEEMESDEGKPGHHRRHHRDDDGPASYPRD
jgi:hypothetical protein